MCFDILGEQGHEQVIFCHHPATGLRAIIAIHSTALGPALGGVRMRPYSSSDEALADVLQLSRTMTYKSAFAGLNVGGGQAVIIGDPKHDKTEMLLRSFGRYVDSLAGRYIAAGDMGTHVADMEQIYLETEYVTGVHQVHGGSGDSAPFTAHGAIQVLLATCQRRLGHQDISKLKIAIQGLGHTGWELLKLLREQGAQLWVSDIDQEKTERAAHQFGVPVVEPDAIYDLPVDVFSPCGGSQVINSDTLQRLTCSIICGTANNQLANLEMDTALLQKNILYAPDYVVNAGGMINVSLEIDGYNRERAMRSIRSLYCNSEKVFDLSEQKNIGTQTAANQLAEARLYGISQLNQMSSNRASLTVMRRLRHSR